MPLESGSSKAVFSHNVATEHNERRSKVGRAESGATKTKLCLKPRAGFRRSRRSMKKLTVGPKNSPDVMGAFFSLI